MSQFKGFPKGIVNYFDQLSHNNNKEWFDENRSDYDNLVLEPAKHFIVEMGEKLKTIVPNIKAIPQVNKSLFRLNKDVRFSKDKTPYKTHLGIWFWEGEKKRMECPGFYFHLEPGKLMLGVGMHIFPKEIMTPYRESVVHDKYGKELKSAVDQVLKSGYLIGTKHYKRVPQGFDANHPNVDLLLHNGLTAMTESDIPDVIFNEGIIDHCLNHYKAMSPIHKWLYDLTTRI